MDSHGYIPTETVLDHYSTPSALHASPTSLTTSFVELQIRATSEESSSSTKKSTSKHSSKCTDSQRCETGQDTSSLTIALAVTIPCVVFLSVIGYFMFRSYKKGKLEAKDDNDPDFYGETTILPDYPMKHNIGPDSDSLYSSGQNPFQADNTRYPTKAISTFANPQSRNMSRGAPSMSTVQAEPYYESFTLPYQHTMGSKHSLNEFAKGMGSEYQAYQISSRPGSRPQSPYRSANSSAVNLNTERTRQLTEKSTENSYEGETTESPYSYVENKVQNDSIVDDDTANTTVRMKENVFADPAAVQYDAYDAQDKRYSEMSYIEDEPEMLNTTHESALRSESALKSEVVPDDYETQEKETVAKAVKKGVAFDAKEDDEDDEDIKRMRSVYKVYFDRENSMKRPGEAVSAAALEDAPPLPIVDLEQDEDEHDEVRELQEPVDNFLSTEAPASLEKKKHRVVSSVYSTIPLQFDQHYPSQQQPQQSYQQQYPQQQYQDQQPQQLYHHNPPQQAPPQLQHIYQPPHQQSPSGYGSPYGSPAGSPRLRPQYSGQPPAELPQLQTVPTPSKIEYSDVVTSTEYAPTKSLTGGSRPQDISVRPFNPLHYSDQIFTPTSPVSSTGQFEAPQPQLRDAAPPSPHHLRHSIVMTDPVGIGKQKIYRPAGAFSHMNSANSSRAGSLTSQSAYAPPPQKDGELLPRSGSKSDLRQQLGSSENYNFV